MIVLSSAISVCMSKLMSSVEMAVAVVELYIWHRQNTNLTLPELLGWNIATFQTWNSTKGMPSTKHDNHAHLKIHHGFFIPNTCLLHPIFFSIQVPSASKMTKIQISEWIYQFQIMPKGKESRQNNYMLLSI